MSTAFIAASALLVGFVIGVISAGFLLIWSDAKDSRYQEVNNLRGEVHWLRGQVAAGRNVNPVRDQDDPDWWKDR